MANPTRPVQDAIIDPAWGQWVHDAVANQLLHIKMQTLNLYFDGGNGTIIPKASLGLSAVAGYIAMPQVPTTATIMTNVVINGAGDPQFAILKVTDMAGNLTYLVGNAWFSIIAFGTPV